MKSPIRLGRTATIAFTSVYLAGTLAFRFIIEADLQGYVLISVGIGIFMLVLLWTLFYIKFLNL